MLIVVSPAKSLDFETPSPIKKNTKLRLMKEVESLISICKNFDSIDLQNLMKISEKLANLNVERFQHWDAKATYPQAKQALFAFTGDVYTGLDAQTFNKEDIDFAQQHLRMLSGLYGVLRPLDLMQPYRLEMGTALQNDRGKNLYDFWDNSVTELLQKDLKKMSNPCLINLASNEYFKVIKTQSFMHPIYTPVFKDYKNGQYKIISFLAKKARGMMSRFIIQNQLQNPEDIKAFNLEGYKFHASSSNEYQWVFQRKQ